MDRAKSGDLFDQFINLFKNRLANSTPEELRVWFKNISDNPYESQFSIELIKRLEELIAERKRLIKEARRL